MQELRVTNYPFVFDIVHLPGLLIVDRWKIATLKFEVQELGKVEIEVDGVTVKKDPKGDKNSTRVSIQGRMGDQEVELRLSVAVQRTESSEPHQERKNNISTGWFRIQGVVDDAEVEVRLSVTVRESAGSSEPRWEKKDYIYSGGMLYIK
ncbi:MAG: hypothetical protein R3B71_04935, partial [Candidatus Gracilibacteria bacterium]|nr:hypothetical protein [Candidatus Peregrinibacteria bacterium]